MADPSSSVIGLNALIAFIASWFTPSSLFLLLNLVIGTIVVISRFGGQRRAQQHYQLGPDGTPVQLVRTPSLLERVKSINLSLYKFEPTHPESEFHYHHQPVESQYVQPYPNPDSSTSLTREPSLLERLKSINFQSLYRSDSTNYEREPHQPAESDYVQPHSNPDNSTPLAQAPSLLERLKSIKFQSLYRSDSTSSEKERQHSTEMEYHAGEDANPDHASSQGHINSVKRSKSETGTETVKKPAEKMKKSASEKAAAVSSSEEEDVTQMENRRPWTCRTENRRSDTTSLLDEEDCVNTKADDFIKRFKQQLRLQRLDSLLRYRNANAN